jgi:predicted anti-sigma-YlaC factor YlaD
MNCTQTREIMDAVLDGSEHSQAASARTHMAGCEDCREWLASAERAAEMITCASARLPQIDISMRVMSQLPDRHPASVPAQRVWVSRRALAWMAAGWAVATCALITLGVAAVRWLDTVSCGEHVMQSYAGMRTIAETTTAVFAALRPVATAVTRVAEGYRADAVTLLCAFLLLESMILIMGCAVWRRRSRIPGSMSVLV